MAKVLIIRVSTYSDYKVFSDLVELVGGRLMEIFQSSTADYYDIYAELTLDQSLVILESLNGRGRLLAPNMTQA